MRTAAMSLTSGSGLVVILLSVAVVQVQNKWSITYPSTRICALRGSTVQIHSIYSCPSKINGRETTVEKSFWFIEKFLDLRTQPEFLGRVQYNCVPTNCTVTISDLRETDSALYKFRITTNHNLGKWFGSSGVSLSVTAHPDLQVHVRKSSPCPSYICVHVDLRCESRCLLPDNSSFTWFKNGREIQRHTSSSYSDTIYSADNISCAVKGYAMSPSPPMFLPSVSVSPSGQIVEGSSVTLTCTNDGNLPGTKYTWYKEDEDSPKASGQNFPITYFRSEHSGYYYCEVEDSSGCRKSVSHLIVLSDSSRSVGVTFAVLLPIILLFALIFFKKKRTFIQSSEPEVTPDSSEQHPPSQRQSEEQDTVHYVAVNLSQNQEDPIYCNTGPAQRHRHNKELIFTEYASVKFSDTSQDRRTELQGTEEDPALLYSTVNKPWRT